MGSIVEMRALGVPLPRRELSPGMDESVALMRLPHISLRPRDAFG